MKKISVHLACFLGALLCCVAVHAQTDGGDDCTGVADYGDMDCDGVTDSLWYDRVNEKIMIVLSSRGFEPFGIEYTLRHPYALSASEGGLVVVEYHMRSNTTHSFAFEPETGRFRLTHFFHENYGNATNDGSGTMTLDLLTGEFTGDWNYYDHETEELVPLPTVTVYVYNPPVYFDGDWDYNNPGYQLFDAYRYAYEPVYEQIVEFLGFTYDYDYSELVGQDVDGDMTYDVVACNYEELYRGDLLRLTVSTHCYEEPGNGEFVAQMMVTDIEVLQPGPLRLFHENNSKTIDYRDDSQYVDIWGTRRLDAIDWFLAATDKKRVKKYLRKPGKLWVTFHDYSMMEEEDDSVWFIAEITNDHNGKIENVMKLLIGMDAYDFESQYYLLDHKTGERRRLDI